MEGTRQEGCVRVGRAEGGKTVVEISCMREESLFNFFLKKEKQEGKYRI